MSTGAWSALYVVQMLWWLWLARWGGARAIEGAWAAWLLHPLAWRWDSEGIKLFAWLSMLLSTAWFVFGLIDPSVRPFYP